MARIVVFRSVVLAAGVLLIGACASQPTSSLDEKYFQKEASNYLKFQHEGQTVYCRTEEGAPSLIPFNPNKRCITETALRQAVENHRINRNAVAPAPGAGSGQGYLGWSGR
ncbi:MAG TPA: hypothetical protein VIV63_02865 [Steroidobacteraceae bacterium]